MPLKSSITSCVYWSWSLSGWPPVPAIVSIQKVACICVARALPTFGSLAAVKKRGVRGPAAPFDDAVGGRDVQERPALHAGPLQRLLQRGLKDAVGVLDDVLQIGLRDASGLLAKLRRDRQVELAEGQRHLVELGVVVGTG